MDSDVRRRLIGYGTMLLANICFTASGAAVQALERRVPDFQLALLRYIGAISCAALFIYMNNATEREIPQESYFHVLLMGMSALGFNCLYFFAVAFVPLSHVSFTCVFYLIVTATFMKIMFDKSPNIMMWMSITGCILGMLCLIQPWKDFTHGFIPGFMTYALNMTVPPANLTSYEPEELSLTWLTFGYLSLLGAAVFEFFYVILAGVYLNQVKPVVLMFLISGVAIPMSFISSFYLEQPVLITDPYTIALLSVHVVTTAATTLCQIAACQLISPIHIAIIANLLPVMNLIPQYTILGDYLYGRRNALEVAGCILIVASITVSGMFNNEHKHEDFIRY